MKTIPRLFLAALVTALAVTFTACSTTVNTIESANPQATISPEAMKKIITDSSLESAVTPVMLNTGTAPDGKTLKVQLQVRNNTRKTAYVNYRVDWFDWQGMFLPGYNPQMTSLAIEGGEIKAVTAVAPSPNAADYRFTFLEKKGD